MTEIDWNKATVCRHIDGCISLSICIDGNWVSKPQSHHVWELVNGEIPDGFVIHHINGDCSDNSIGNLIAVNRSDHRKIHNRYKSMIVNSVSTCKLHRRIPRDLIIGIGLTIEQFAKIDALAGKNESRQQFIRRIIGELK